MAYLHMGDGLGQDPSLDSLPITVSDTWTPIVQLPLPSVPQMPDNWYAPPAFDPTSAAITGTLMPPPAGTIVELPPTIQPSGVALELTSAPITGNLNAPVSPVPSPPTSATVNQATGIIASVGNLFKSIFGGSAQASTQHLVPTFSNVTPAGQAAFAAGTLHSGSWFTDPAQEMIQGVPNWGILAVAVVGGALVFGGGRRSAQYRFSRRRNPAELILMGANPFR